MLPTFQVDGLLFLALPELPEACRRFKNRFKQTPRSKKTGDPKKPKLGATLRASEYHKFKHT